MRKIGEYILNNIWNIISLFLSLLSLFPIVLKIPEIRIPLKYSLLFFVGSYIFCTVYKMAKLGSRKYWRYRKYSSDVFNNRVFKWNYTDHYRQISNIQPVCPKCSYDFIERSVIEDNQLRDYIECRNPKCRKTFPPIPGLQDHIEYEIKPLIINFINDKNYNKSKKASLNRVASILNISIPHPDPIRLL